MPRFAWSQHWRTIQAIVSQTRCSSERSKSAPFSRPSPEIHLGASTSLCPIHSDWPVVINCRVLWKLPGDLSRSSFYSACSRLTSKLKYNSFFPGYYNYLSQVLVGFINYLCWSRLFHQNTTKISILVYSYWILLRWSLIGLYHCSWQYWWIVQNIHQMYTNILTSHYLVST